MTTATIAIEQLPARLAHDLDDAFPHVVRALQDDVFSGALRMVGNWADAEDVTQEAFLRAYRALQGYDRRRIEDLRLRGWVWTIAANLARNRWRTRSRKPEAPLPERDPPTGGDGPEDEALTDAGLASLSGHLAELPWAMRAAVVLRHVVDLGYEEIAAALDRPVGTVKADVHRGLARLRTAIEGGRQ